MLAGVMLQVTAMASKPITLGDFHFSSKKEANQFYSEILNRVALNEALENADFDYVMALLLNHPQSEEKIGVGVKEIKIAVGLHAGNRCFHVVRTDDSVEDFSIGKCVNGEHSDFYKLCIACRRAVENDVRGYKRKFFEENSDSNEYVKCSATGVQITYKQAHVDHREPFTFSALVHFFSKAQNIDIGAVIYERSGKYGNEFQDTALSEAFRLWHKENAKLRIIHSASNLKKGYLGRVTSTKADGKIQ